MDELITKKFFKYLDITGEFRKCSNMKTIIITTNVGALWTILKSLEKRMWGLKVQTKTDSLDHSTVEIDKNTVKSLETICCH